MTVPRCHCGQPPRTNLEAEAGSLARLLEGDASILTLLRAENFHSRAHAAIFEAIGEVHARDGRITVDRVVAALAARKVFFVHAGVPVPDYLAEIVEEHSWGSTAARYARRVLAAWRAREVSAALVRADALVRVGFDVDRVLAALNAKVNAISLPAVPTRKRRAA